MTVARQATLICALCQSDLSLSFNTALLYGLREQELANRAAPYSIYRKCIVNGAGMSNAMYGTNTKSVQSNPL